MNELRNFSRDENGASSIEYGLLAIAISIAIIVVLIEMGSNLTFTFSNVSNGLN